MYTVLKAVVIAFLSSIFASVAFAYTFRFPILRMGFIGPFGEHSTYVFSLPQQAEILLLVLLNWLMWGFLGTFIAIPLLGVLVGVIGYKCRVSDWKLVVSAMVAGALPITYIALYDVIFVLSH